MEEVEGDDGQTVTQIRFSGGSGDLYDEGFQTIMRNSSFRVLSRFTT
jgi:hypothetical protein